ncbi:hypothetical protein [Deinococcus irradiatisoli]|uniref:hypothetical protein n=1 Tax=Deinococcus irradiatisoli TaxID=2202254 RepID=UPI0011B1DE2F|nr:hypothetical protein [Deinococcus irradiatisoli]
MKLLLPLLSLSLLLAACTTPAPPTPVKTVASVSVVGASTLKIGGPASLTATAKDSGGNALSGQTFTWTSSAPNVVSVDAGGTLTVKRLSATPVILSATDGDKVGTLSVTTYGLELTMGTFNSAPGSSDPKIGTAALVKFRAPGSATAINGSNAVQLSGPADVSDLKLQIGPVTGAQDYDWDASIQAAPVSGSYSAAVTVDGVNYTSSDTLNAASLLGGFQNGSFQLTGSTGYTLSGSFASGTTFFQPVLLDKVNSDAEPIFFDFKPIVSLPKSYSFSPAIPVSTYTPLIESFNQDYSSFAALTPEEFNLSVTVLPATSVN